MLSSLRLNMVNLATHIIKIFLTNLHASGNSSEKIWICQAEIFG